MNKLLALALMLFASASLAFGDDQNQLKLQIIMTRGESSRDSHSVKTTIAVSGQKLTYTRSYTGRLSGRAPERKEFDLTADDVRKIADWVKSKNLLVTENVERSGGPKGSYLWFDLRIRSEVDGATGLINIRGPRGDTSFDEARVYKDSVALIEQLYEILHRLDKDLVYVRLRP